MNEGNKLGEISSARLSQGQKSREQECQDCERGINVENCRNCIFDILTTADIDNGNQRRKKEK